MSAAMKNVLRILRIYPNLLTGGLPEVSPTVKGTLDGLAKGMKKGDIVAGLRGMTGELFLHLVKLFTTAIKKVLAGK